MKILITGSSGMLGQALCGKLVVNHDVVGIDIKELSALSSQLSAFHKLDITDRDLAIQRIEEAAPQIVIHCASYTDVDGCELNPQKAHQLNTTATAIIAEGCKLASSHMIYISTDFVFDGKKSSPYTEKDKPNPINIYGKTKLDGENIIKDALDKYLIIRTSWLFGKGGKNFVEAIIEQAKSDKDVVAQFIGQKKELKVVDDQVGCPTYTVDLAEAITSIISKEQRAKSKEQKVEVFNSTPLALSSKLLHITNHGSCSWYEFAKEILALAGIKGVEIVPMSSEELDRPAKRPKMSILDNAQFQRIYGKNLPHWKDALRKYLEKSTMNTAQ